MSRKLSMKLSHCTDTLKRRCNFASERNCTVCASHRARSSARCTAAAELSTRWLCQFLQWNFHILFLSCTASNLLCISAPVFTGGWVPAASAAAAAAVAASADAAAWLLQMFKVSLFIIYAATVLDFG